MLRRVNLKKLHTSRVTYELYDEKPLPWSDSSVPRPDKPQEVMVDVGTLQAGDAWVSTATDSNPSLAILGFLQGLFTVPNIRTLLLGGS